jgi:hypothetical protein
MLSKLYRQYQDQPEFRQDNQDPSPHDMPPYLSAAMDTLLAPVHQDLLTLKSTTPDNLPPYNPRVRSKRHAEVLKQKLLPIGMFIFKILSSKPEEERSSLELQLCRHIAAKYWPLPTNVSTHLKVHTMYRNVIFRHQQRLLRTLESASSTNTTLHKPETQTYEEPSQSAPDAHGVKIL